MNTQYSEVQIYNLRLKLHYKKIDYLMISVLKTQYFTLELLGHLRRIDGNLSTRQIFNTTPRSRDKCDFVFFRIEFK